MKILHITVHTGGGIGTVLRNWIEKDKQNEHTILLLNRNYYGENSDKIFENIRGRGTVIDFFVEKSDIVIIHFWNHPLLFEFLIKTKLPKARVCIWSHVSGLYPPYVHTKNLKNYPDRFFYSSPISGKGEYIWTTGGIEKYLNINKKTIDSEFKIGYIGTLDYAKLHPKFIDMCDEIRNKIPNVKFIICGSGCDEEKITNKVNIFGLKEIVEFKGFINNIKEVLQTFDIFGYPLNEKHFGTCEQVLGEAMACGIEPVVLDNPSEKFIVGGFGRVSKNINRYVDNVIDMYNNRIDKSKELKERAIELYDINKMINKWNNVFKEMMCFEKKEREWKNKVICGSDIFIESLGKYGKIFKENDKHKIKELFNSNNQWRSKSKGSVYQYLEVFPNDTKLQEWSNI